MEMASPQMAFTRPGETQSLSHPCSSGLWVPNLKMGTGPAAIRGPLGLWVSCLPCGSFPFMEPLSLHEMGGRGEEGDHAGPVAGPAYFCLLI